MFNVNSSYTRFMAEAEGDTSITSTRETKINAAIKDFIMVAKTGLDIDDPNIQTAILEDYDLESLTKEEADYIAKEVRKRLRNG